VIRTRAGQGLFLLRRMGTSDAERIQVEIRGYDLETANLLAGQVKTALENIEGVTDARLSRETGTPEELIIIDRQKAADMKVTVSQIARTLQTILTGTHASNYREGGREYWIRVKVKDSEHLTIDDLLDLTLTNADGQPVVLRNVVDIRPQEGRSESNAKIKSALSQSMPTSADGIWDLFLLMPARAFDLFRYQGISA